MIKERCCFYNVRCVSLMGLKYIIVNYNLSVIKLYNRWILWNLV